MITDIIKIALLLVGTIALTYGVACKLDEHYAEVGKKPLCNKFNYDKNKTIYAKGQHGNNCIQKQDLSCNA